MRTSDPNIASQLLLRHMSGNANIYQATQHQGVYIGYVTDTHTNNDNVQKGTLKFAVPFINENAGWPAAPFPGLVDPPLGTECVVAFEGTFGNAPRVIAFTNWQSPVITVSATDPVSTYKPTKGDLWIQP